MVTLKHRGNIKAGTQMRTKRLANSSHWARGKWIFCEPEANAGHSVPNSLCIRAKNQQILVCSEWYVNHLQAAQRTFAVPSTHTRIWFVNCLVRMCVSALISKCSNALIVFPLLTWLQLFFQRDSYFQCNGTSFSFFHFDISLLYRFFLNVRKLVVFMFLSKL